MTNPIASLNSAQWRETDADSWTLVSEDDRDLGYVCQRPDGMFVGSLAGSEPSAWARDTLKGAKLTVELFLKNTGGL